MRRSTTLRARSWTEFRRRRRCVTPFLATCFLAHLRRLAILSARLAFRRESRTIFRCTCFGLSWCTRTARTARRSWIRKGLWRVLTTGWVWKIGLRVPRICTVLTFLRIAAICFRRLALAHRRARRALIRLRKIRGSFFAQRLTRALPRRSLEARGRARCSSGLRAVAVPRKSFNLRARAIAFFLRALWTRIATILCLRSCLASASCLRFHTLRARSTLSIALQRARHLAWWRAWRFAGLRSRAARMR